MAEPQRTLYLIATRNAMDATDERKLSKRAICAVLPRHLDMQVAVPIDVVGVRDNENLLRPAAGELCELAYQ